MPLIERCAMGALISLRLCGSRTAVSRIIVYDETLYFLVANFYGQCDF